MHRQLNSQPIRVYPRDPLLRHNQSKLITSVDVIPYIPYPQCLVWRLLCGWYIVWPSQPYNRLLYGCGSGFPGYSVPWLHHNKLYLRQPPVKRPTRDFWSFVRWSEFCTLQQHTFQWCVARYGHRPVSLSTWTVASTVTCLQKKMLWWKTTADH